MLAIIEWAAIFWFIVKAVIYTAIAMGLGYLGGKLFGKQVEKESGRGADAQSRSWTPHSTEREGIPRPRAYGKNMHHGNIIAKWTDVSGEEREILYMIVDHGDGPTKGIFENQVYLNDQPVGNFSDVQVQERRGTMDQTAMEGFDKTKLEYTINTELVYGADPITFTTPNDYFDDLEYTIMFPNGLHKFQKDGDRKASVMQIRMRIREVGAVGWSEHTHTITRNVLDPIFIKYTVSELGFNVEFGKQYEIDFLRLSGMHERTVNNVYIKSVREVISVGFERPGKVLVGIRAVATEQLSGSVDVKVLREDRLVNVFDGTEWNIEYSRNRAWVVWDILTQPVISGNGDDLSYIPERYEGLQPESLDVEFFYQWAQWCDYPVPSGQPPPNDTEDRMPCDLIVDFTTDIWTLANEVADIGRAHLYWAGHLLTGWIEASVDGDIVDLITMDNTLARSWRSNGINPDELAGRIEVFYNDARMGYERTFATYGNELISQQSNIVGIEGVGITSRGVAIHVAMFETERNKRLRNFNSFRMHKDAFRYKLGQVVKLQARTPNWGQAYRVMSANASMVTLNRDVEAGVEAGHHLLLRGFNPIAQIVSIDAYEIIAIDGREITIDGEWAYPPLKHMLAAIDTGIVTRRIVKIEPTVDNYFDVFVETYDPELYETDDWIPHNPGEYIWPAGVSRTLAPPITRQEVISLINALMPPQLDIEIPWWSNIDWTGNEVDTIYWAARDISEPITFRYRGVSYEITADDTTDEFVYWDPDYTTVFRTTNIASVALAPGNWLMCINRAGVPHPANAMQLLHAGVLLAGTIRAEHYLELRNTYVYNGDDSLDSVKPLEIPFRIVSEMTAIQSVKLSFRIMPFRAYSTAAASGGGQTSSSGGSGTYDSTGPANWGLGGETGGPSPTSTSSVDPGDTNDTDLGSHHHNQPGYTGYESNGNHRHSLNSTYDYNMYSHYHTMPSHSHTLNVHTHSLGSGANHYHSLSIPNHTHTVSNHTHGVTYGLYEESNSPTVHFHINNGAGFGAASTNYTADQLDIDITSLITGTGWKAVRFDTDLRCRVFAIIECKIDITA